MKEGRTIQQRLPRSDPSNGSSNLACNFSNLMFAGKCKAALDLLSNSSSRGLIHLNNPVDASNPDSPSVKQILISKHPEGQPAYSSCIIPLEPEDPHPIIFDALNGDAIHSAALKVNGASSPSGIDAYGWRRLCTCFKDASRNLCEALASTARRISSTYVDPTLITPLLACRRTKIQVFIPLALGRLPDGSLPKPSCSLWDLIYKVLLGVYNYVEVKLQGLR